MYGIFTYIWLIFMVHVGKYTIHGSYGIESTNHQGLHYIDTRLISYTLGESTLLSSLPGCWFQVSTHLKKIGAPSNWRTSPQGSIGEQIKHMKPPPVTYRSWFLTLPKTNSKSH